MKKYVLMIRNIIFYAGLYLVIQMAAGVLYGIIYAFTHISEGINQNLLQQSLNKDIYIITFLSAAISFVIYILCLRKKEQNIWHRCNFKKITVENIVFSIIIPITYSAFSIALVHYLQKYISSYSKVNETLASSSNSIFSILCVIILLPIFEEILFRGLIFFELKRTTHIIAAVIVQALLFGFFHMNLLQGIYTSVLALVLISLYLLSNSIWASIIGHVVYNICGTIIMPRVLFNTSNYAVLYLIVGALLTSVLLFLMKKRNDKILVNI